MVNYHSEITIVNNTLSGTSEAEAHPFVGSYTTHHSNISAGDENCFRVDPDRHSQRLFALGY